MWSCLKLWHTFMGGVPGLRIQLGHKAHTGRLKSTEDPYEETQVSDLSDKFRGQRRGTLCAEVLSLNARDAS